MRVLNRFEAILLNQRGHLFGWVPVCLAFGIGSYFLLRFEPQSGMIIGVACSVAVLVLVARVAGEAFGPLLMALALIATGFVVAAARAHHVAGPVLNWRYYGPVEGRVVAIDRSASDALRLTLDEVVLERVSQRKTPHRVRVSLHGGDGLGVTPEPGLRIMTTAHLSPPGGPVEPGGFDFQRHAWFGRLGAVGYTRVPVLAIESADVGRVGLVVFRIRMAASARIQQVLPGDRGGFAAAITTGDRSAISQDALESLRISNLAHLLAISGLHMGLLSGFVFGLLRVCFALVPPIVLRLPARKLSAAGALVVSAGYLALSGGNVATERAFIMVAVALCAIMMNRRAISLRAVAIAATIVLLLRPEALLGPGFQMSFAATTALVAVFGWIRDHDVKLGPKWAKPVMAVVISSAVAGFATAPVGAAHFNAIAQYGLLANLLSVPLMGVLVIPAAVLALCLAPFGLEWIGLALMGFGLQWILGVADFVANLGGARIYVPGPGLTVLPLIALGFLWLILWQGRVRFAGVLPMVLALVLWVDNERPAALIAENGTLVGVMTSEGRALSKKKGAGFIARNWLENDGDGASQQRAATRWPSTGVVSVGQQAIVHLSGKRAVAAYEGCASQEIIVASVPFERSPAGCTVLDPDRLRNTGAIALVSQGSVLRMQSVRDVTGTRLWTSWKDN